MADTQFLLYVDQLSRIIDLPIPAWYRDDVAQNLERLMAQAALVLDFPLDDTIEAAAIFIP